MADMNEIKSKVLEALSLAADKARDVAGKTADRTKTYARIAKLSMEINGERDTVKKAYIEIGKLYYDTHKDDPEGFFAQLFEEVSLSMENIAQKQAEIDALKTANAAGDEKDAAADVTFGAVEKEPEEEDQ